tara:strand:+ start:867 stop:1550 length:684 start_codon:yes stop_codon:yes gene_type:complete
LAICQKLFLKKNNGVTMKEKNLNEDENLDLDKNEEKLSNTKENDNQDDLKDDIAESPDEIILKLNKEVDDLKDQRLRVIAELENFRKRAEKDQADALKFGISNFAKEIVNIKDNIERAQSSISEEVRSNDSVKSVVEGLDLIAQSTENTFEKIGIKKIESLDQKFDHNLHQAMMEVERDDVEPGTIVQELIPGYTLHERLLRPAMVGVSKKTQQNQSSSKTEDEISE